MLSEKGSEMLNHGKSSSPYGVTQVIPKVTTILSTTLALLTLKVYL
jgi:hypothetical protein